MVHNILHMFKQCVNLMANKRFPLLDGLHTWPEDNVDGCPTVDKTIETRSCV